MTRRRGRPPFAEGEPPYPPSHFVVIDLEATCDRRGWPREAMEIIEIGAVLVEAASLDPVAEFQTFVRPVIHPTLTAFCTELTSITQADVDAAPTYPEAAAAMKAAMLSVPRPLFCSWGAYDRGQFERDSARHQVPYPLPGHWNLKSAFSAGLRSRRRYGMRGALERVGLALVGTHHRGIDDARNIARLLPFALGRARFPEAPVGWRRTRRAR